MTLTERTEFHFALLSWFKTHQRKMPWRTAGDAYSVWVSELMLQQTQVATVIPYWHRWMLRFPTVELLAQAEESEVMSHWQGLGYYRRARALHAGAKSIVLNGWPKSAAEWERLPGVGRYTAGAIASIASGEPVPLVDGNVERVFARLADRDSIGPALNRAAWKWANENLFIESPGDWNQALMELGATICRPRSPECNRCPIQSYCLAHQNGTVELRPTAVATRASVILQHAVFVPLHDNFLGIRQIAPGQWWEGMWEFPRCNLQESKATRNALGNGDDTPLGAFKHQVTHHRIQITATLVDCLTQSSELEWVDEAELARRAMPAPQRKIAQMVIRNRSGRNLFDVPSGR